MTEIKSEEAKVGQLVNLEVAEDVYGDEFLAIPAGTPATGQIIRCEARHYSGIGGELAITNFYIVPRKSEKIRLDGIFRVEGKDRTESVVIGRCCFFGYLIKGPGPCQLLS